MNANLELVKAELSAIDEDARQAILGYHRLGVRARAVCDECIGWQREVEMIAHSARVEPSAVQYAMALVDWIPSEETLNKLLNRIGIRGIRLTWQHIIKLVKVADTVYREKVVELVFERGLSPKALARMLRPRRPKVNPQALLPRSVPGALGNIAVMAQRLSMRLSILPELAFEPAYRSIVDPATRKKLGPLALETKRSLNELLTLATDADMRLDELIDACHRP